MTGNGGKLYVQQLKAAGVEYIFCQSLDRRCADLSMRWSTSRRSSSSRASRKAPSSPWPTAMRALLGQARRCPCRQCRAAQRHDADGQHLQGPHPDAAHGGRVRPATRSARTTPQDYDIQETCWRRSPSGAGWRRRAGIPETTRRVAQIRARRRPPGRCSSSIPDERAAHAGDGQIMDGSALRRADEDPRPTRKTSRRSREDADRGEEPAALGRRRDHPVPWRGRGGGACRAAGPAGLRPGGIRRMVEAVPDAKPALYRRRCRATCASRARSTSISTSATAMPSDRRKGATLISIRQDPTEPRRGVWPVDLGVVARHQARRRRPHRRGQEHRDRGPAQADGRRPPGRVADYTGSRSKLSPEHRRRSRTTARPSSCERLAVELEKRPRQGHDLRHRLRQRQGDGSADGVRRQRTRPISAPAPTSSAGAWRRRSAPSSPAGSARWCRSVGDGSALFGGPQPLWSMARYKAPVTDIVVNNRSYNNERNRIWTFSRRRAVQDRPRHACYNGSPDVDFAKAAQAFGVEGEVVQRARTRSSRRARPRQAAPTSRAGPISSISMSSATASAPPRPGIRPTRSPSSARGRSDRHDPDVSWRAVAALTRLPPRPRSRNSRKPRCRPARAATSSPSTCTHMPCAVGHRAQMRMNADAGAHQVYDMILHGAQIAPDQVDKAVGLSGHQFRSRRQRAAASPPGHLAGWTRQGPRIQ